MTAYATYPEKQRTSAVPKAAMPTLRLVGPPIYARKFGRCLLALFLLFPVALVFVPWVQTVQGSGRVIALDPGERQQIIEAPLEGRVKTWHVQEGSRVRAGDPLVDIEDNDPDLPERLQRQEEILGLRVNAARDRVESIDRQIKALEQSRKFAESAAADRVKMAQERVAAADEARRAAASVAHVAQRNYARQKSLFEGQLVSERDMELALQSHEVAQVEVKRTEAAWRQAKSDLSAVSEERNKVGTDFQGLLDAARASQRQAEADMATAERDLQEMRVRVARQKTQFVKAPSDGTILRLVANANQGGMVVKAGAPLAILVPDVQDRTRGVVAEIWVSGNDAPLLRPGNKVRLQFEGWPAVQFSGWPAVAVGTFGGQVLLVDATDDGQGKFRVLVQPDPAEQATNPWPAEQFLRQGVRTHGWVLLNQVRLGFEMWRRLNGFPPVIDRIEPSSADKGKGEK